MKKTNYIRISKYAILVGISPQAVRKRISAGKLKTRIENEIKMVQYPENEEIKNPL